MNVISSYHRIVWFHNNVLQEHYPNARKIAEQFEISLRQAQRDIEYLRSSMNAPLVYYADKRGYRYEAQYTLPSFFLSESEKAMLSSLAQTYDKIGAFGFSNYKNRATLLSKLSSIEKAETQLTKEPFIAELQILSGRVSTEPLDYFVCQRIEKNIISYAFFDPDVFISVLLCSHLDFKIIKPNWLKEYLKERLTNILSLL